MYDELVNALRVCADGEHCIKCSKWELKLNAGRNACEFAICTEAADAIEELSKPRWIPVTERLPRDRQFVLVYCGDNKRIRPSDRFDVAILLGDSIFTSLGVTHWMPLPEPPKEG